MIEKATDDFLDIGVGKEGSGWVVIRCGGLGAYVKSRATKGRWIEAFWTEEDVDKVIDVTGTFLRLVENLRPYHGEGAGNSFLGGFAAGLRLSGGDVYEGRLSGYGSKTTENDALGLRSNSTRKHLCVFCN